MPDIVKNHPDFIFYIFLHIILYHDITTIISLVKEYIQFFDAELLIKLYKKLYDKSKNYNSNVIQKFISIFEFLYKKEVRSTLSLLSILPNNLPPEYDEKFYKDILYENLQALDFLQEKDFIKNKDFIHDIYLKNYKLIDFIPEFILKDNDLLFDLIFIRIDVLYYINNKDVQLLKDKIFLKSIYNKIKGYISKINRVFYTLNLNFNKILNSMALEYYYIDNNIYGLKFLDDKKYNDAQFSIIGLKILDKIIDDIIKDHINTESDLNSKIPQYILSNEILLNQSLYIIIKKIFSKITDKEKYKNKIKFIIDRDKIIQIFLYLPDSELKNILEKIMWNI